MYLLKYVSQNETKGSVQCETQEVGGGEKYYTIITNFIQFLLGSNPNEYMYSKNMHEPKGMEGISSKTLRRILSEKAGDGKNP